MGTVVDYESIAPANDTPGFRTAVYDFAVDAGATGVLDLLTFTKQAIIHRAWFKVNTTFTSGGSATLIIGIKGGDTDAVLQSTAVASLVAGAVFSNDAAAKDLKVAANGVISMTIGTAAMTAGLGMLVVEYSLY